MDEERTLRPYFWASSLELRDSRTKEEASDVGNIAEPLLLPSYIDFKLRLRFKKFIDHMVKSVPWNLTPFF